MTADYYIDIGPWQIRINSPRPEIVQGIAGMFNHRFGTAPWPGKKHLHCVIHDQAEAFAAKNDNITFDGPIIDVSPGVVINYALVQQKTLLKVTHTAIIEFDDQKPDKCHVFLDPAALVCHPQAERVPCPEAFFYPMLAEWIRNVGACLVHCGAVAVNGYAIMLTGPPGSGKSTHVLRMLQLGADFLADDLAILRRHQGKVQLLPLREVANVNSKTLDRFSELSHLRSAPLRGDGKFSVNIRKYFGQHAATCALPGAVLRLEPDQNSWCEEYPASAYLNNMHDLAWFGSRPDANKDHFWLLADWLLESRQWRVTQGYLAGHLSDLMNDILRLP